MLSELILRYPRAKIFALERDPFGRSVSAYKRSQCRFSKTLSECVELESAIIKSLGGVRVIFESVEQLSRFLVASLEHHIDYSIVYASLLMKNWSALVSEELQAKISVIGIDDQTKALTSLSIVNKTEIHILNSSDDLQNDLSNLDIETLQNALNDQSLI